MNYVIVNIPFSDDELIDVSQRMLAGMNTYWDRFVDRDDAVFTNGFRTEVQGAIDALMLMETNELILEQGKRLTQQRDKFLAQARQYWDDFKYFLKKANSKALAEEHPDIRDVFGTDNYKRSNRKAYRMVRFWNNIITKVGSVAYSSFFQGINMPSTMLDKLGENMVNLKKAQDEMIAFSVLRLEKTIERNNCRKNLFDLVQLIAEVGKYLFKQDSARYNLFVIRSGTYRPIPTETVEPNTKQGVFVEELEETSVLVIQNVGTVPLIVYAAEDINVPTPVDPLVVDVGGRVTVSVTQIWVDEEFRMLVLQNDSNSTGKIRVVLN